MTTYIVLQKRGIVSGTATTEGGEAYTVLGSAEASGPEQALRKLVGDCATAGSFVAVPLRNWTIIESEIFQPAPKMLLREVEFVPGQMSVEEILSDEEPPPDSTPDDHDEEPGS